MLLAFLIYNDGIGTIMRMATIYGDRDRASTRASMIASILIVQFVGIPFAFLFGMLAGRIGAKRSIALGLLVYAVICVVGYFMTTGDAFPDPGHPGGDGAGGDPGAEPVAVRQPDPARQVGRVLRVLRRSSRSSPASSGPASSP